MAAGDEVNGGGPVQIQPAILISYDPATQVVDMQINPSQIKNWSFAKRILQDATDLADLNMRMAQAAMLQQQQQAAAQSQAIAQNLRKLRG
jgi:hypothetical protein